MLFAMSVAKANGIELEYDTVGDAAAPAVVLIMGYTQQMIAWDERFCAALAARGFYVVRFDNRDVGLSSKIESGPAYALDDMADDTIGLLDALGLRAGHLVGASMGGMIAQLAALRHPARVLSLASIMSTTGERAVSVPTPAAWTALTRPVPADRAANLEQALEAWRVLSSPGHPFEEERLRERCARAYDRCYYPPGLARQFAAIFSARDRTSELATLEVPTVVIHGKDDPLIPPMAGEATARAIPGAELVLVERMGHELPEVVWPEVIEAIAKNAHRARAT